MIAGPEPSRAGPPPVLNEPILADLKRHLGNTQVDQFIEQFITQCRECVAIIANSGDRDKVRQNAHIMVSLAGNLGCMELMTNCRLLMNDLRSGTADVTAQVAAVNASAIQAVAALEKYLAA